MDLRFLMDLPIIELYTYIWEILVYDSHQRCFYINIMINPNKKTIDYSNNNTPTESNVKKEINKKKYEIWNKKWEEARNEINEGGGEGRKFNPKDWTKGWHFCLFLTLICSFSLSNYLFCVSFAATLDGTYWNKTFPS